MSSLTVLRDAVQEAYGLPCDDFDPECAGCRAWKALFVTREQFERLRAENARFKEALVEAMIVPEAFMLSGRPAHMRDDVWEQIQRSVTIARAVIQTKGRTNDQT